MLALCYHSEFMRILVIRNRNMSAFMRSLINHEIISYFLRYAKRIFGKKARPSKGATLDVTTFAFSFPQIISSLTHFTVKKMHHI